jgi:hypothetical protein
MDIPQGVVESLGPEERVSWVGQPKQGIRVYAIDFLQIPLSIVGVAFVLWILKDLATEPGAGAPYWIAVAIATGFAGLAARTCGTDFCGTATGADGLLTSLRTVTRLSWCQARAPGSNASCFAT